MRFAQNLFVLVIAVVLFPAACILAEEPNPYPERVYVSISGETALKNWLSLLEPVPNKMEVYTSNIGAFRVISSWGEYSKDPLGESQKGSNSSPCQMIQVPDGKWRREVELVGSTVQDIVSYGEQTFIFTSNCVYECSGSGEIDEVLEMPQGMKLLKPKPPKPVNSLYHQIEKQANGSSEFAGFLLYDLQGKKWKTISYQGRKVGSIHFSHGFGECDLRGNFSRYLFYARSYEPHPTENRFVYYINRLTFDPKKEKFLWLDRTEGW